jgi:phage shock protein PspC (stress-responsive transcriptional regulator)
MRTITERVVQGSVGGAGNIYRPGSGDWMVTKSGTGVYIVRFRRFPNQPSVSGNANGLAVFYLVDVQVDFIQVNMYAIDNTAGVSLDSGFSFRVSGKAG